MGRTTVPIILHGSKHSVLGASARRPILVYQAATSEGELRRISFHALEGIRQEEEGPGRIPALFNSLYRSQLLPDPFHIRDEALGFYQPPQSSL
jgi:hypothetical protein